MKLLHTEYGLDITLRENEIIVISIENATVYTKILSDFWNQCHGGDGGFILSEGEKIKNIAKEMEVVFNPFLLDCNDKKIISKLYQELKEQSNDMFFEEGMALNTHIVTYIDKVINQVPYALNYNPDFEITNLLKIYNVEIESLGKTLLERVVDYLRVMGQICMIKTFVFVGMKQYFTEEEIKQLYEFVFYEKINLIIIESIHVNHIESEKCWIIDKDLCIIEM